MPWTSIPRLGSHEEDSPYGNVEDWRRLSRSFESLAVYDPSSVTVTGGSHLHSSAYLLPFNGQHTETSAVPASRLNPHPERTSPKVALSGSWDADGGIINFSFILTVRF